MRTIKITSATIAAAAAAAVTFPASASAQEGAFGGAPTGVPMPSPSDVVVKKKGPDPDECDYGYRDWRIERVLRSYDAMGQCSAFTRDMWTSFNSSQYSSDIRSMASSWKNSDRKYDAYVMSFFVYHDVDFDFIEGLRRADQLHTTDSLGGLEALAALEGTPLPAPPHGNRHAGRGHGGAFAASAPSAPVPAPTQPTATAPADAGVGACGVPLSTGLTAEAQTEADRIGTCDQIRQVFGG